MEYNQRNKMICTNCGKSGHEYRFCSDPISSFGVINIKINTSDNENMIIREKFSTETSILYKIISKKYPSIKCSISDNIKLPNLSANTNQDELHTFYKIDNESFKYFSEDHLKLFGYYRDKIMFLMVSRKFSLGFVEFIRGRYETNDTMSIINLFEQMNQDEIDFIKKNEYDDILYLFLNRYDEEKNIVINRTYEGRYADEYCDAKIKFNILKYEYNSEKYNIDWNLYFYTNNIKPKWSKSEWGFPKGRREKRNEENISCACREFEEETGYGKQDYSILNKIEPIEELLTGTNNIPYKHIYYLSIDKSSNLDYLNNYDKHEIGEIKWLTFDEAILHIRQYHISKKNILTKIYLFVMNFLIHNI